ncbi:MAG: hypothetical protein ISR76_04735 [Planctomycetes bacterium]|nr:hypothetical protein [Planctomycetota bacterium]MBL7008281.1 hypothetical protein [Planctomycetota bacterium]
MIHYTLTLSLSDSLLLPLLSGLAMNTNWHGNASRRRIAWGDLSHLISEDGIYFTGFMAKYACYEPDQSQEPPSSLPEEPEYRADLESLRTWSVSFKKCPAEAGA